MQRPVVIPWAAILCLYASPAHRKPNLACLVCHAMMDQVFQSNNQALVFYAAPAA
jgi:hypothetical protein